MRSVSVSSSLSPANPSAPTHSGTSLTFLTTFLKSYLLTESLDHLSSSLRKGALTNLEAFFPASKASPTELAAYFKAAGLAGVVDFYTKQKSGQAKEITFARLRELVAEEADEDDVRFLFRQRGKEGD